MSVPLQTLFCKGESATLMIKTIFNEFVFMTSQYLYYINVVILSEFKSMNKFSPTT